MASIYYIYISGTTIGYIGQDSGDGVDRICDHIKSAATPNPDSVGRMINQYGLDKLRYKIFYPPYYGLSPEIFELFEQYWTYSGNGDNAYLDLAELLHVIRAKLLHTSAANFNTLIGGFQASGVNATLTYKLNVPENVNDAAVKDILNNFRQELNENRFSVNLQKFEDSWRKIVYPIGYLMLSGPFREALLQYVKTDLIADLFSTNEIKQIILEYIIKSLQDPNKKSHKPTEFNNKIKNEIRRQFQSKTSVISTKIKNILHQVLGGHYIKDFQFSWNIKDSTVDKMMEGIFNRIDNITNLMWERIATLVDGELVVNHQLITKKGARENASDISQSTYDFANSIFTSFTWDKSVEPEWAKKLKSESLIENKPKEMANNPKVLICTCICETLFPIIDTLCSAPTQTNDFGHPRYATSLYSQLRSQKILGGNSVNNNENFMHAILSIWHKMRYGEPDWIMFKDFVNSDEYTGSHYNNMESKIANYKIVKEINDESNIVWYSGKAWKKYRIPANVQDYRAAGILLAQFWPWGDMLDQDKV